MIKVGNLSMVKVLILHEKNYRVDIFPKKKISTTFPDLVTQACSVNSQEAEV